MNMYATKVRARVDEQTPNGNPPSHYHKKVSIDSVLYQVIELYRIRSVETELLD